MYGTQNKKSFCNFYVEKGDMVLTFRVICVGIFPFTSGRVKGRKISDFVQDFPWFYKLNPVILQ
jgi:hypothetical protein